MVACGLKVDAGIRFSGGKSVVVHRFPFNEYTRFVGKMQMSGLKNGYLSFKRYFLSK